MFSWFSRCTSSAGGNRVRGHGDCGCGVDWEGDDCSSTAGVTGAWAGLRLQPGKKTQWGDPQVLLQLEVLGQALLLNGGLQL